MAKAFVSPNETTRSRVLQRAKVCQGLAIRAGLRLIDLTFSGRVSSDKDKVRTPLQKVWAGVHIVCVKGLWNMIIAI